MKKFSILTFAVCLFATSVLVTSCSKEPVDEVVENQVTDYGMEVTMRGSTTKYDAFAAYCDESGIESFSVSNNEALLGNDLWTSDINDGDFVVHYRKDATSEFTVGGTIIESTYMGQTIKNFTMTDNTLIDITIDEANDKEVLGSLSGDFLVILDPVGPVFDTVAFSVTFAGEVDPAIVPIFCK